ncbi:MAG: histidine phosphatase family protein [Desulfobulbus sp.]|jgi:probable phosphoglycerate mutase|uniref:histidine phosphatase family protein n=1 Tax=Desulfobulbus sp. TaxID=895 RepID=UPI0028499FDE|nr:histidine phosphatase family protein [Desulfobulbus sp.]MDR2549050.1 histidine phosphatase family protein [Desulfobulbus sp.]
MRRLIYLLRHGAVDTSSPRRFLGRTDLPLNLDGVRQAQALGGQLRHVPFAEAVASPLQRAVQTAALVSGRPEAAIRMLDALAEIDLGQWEGRTVAEVRQSFPGLYERRGLDLEHVRPPGGESFGDLADRVCPALFALVWQTAGPLLVVAHAGVNRVVLSRLLGRPLRQALAIPQDYGAVNILRAGEQGIEVVAVNLLGPLPAPYRLIATG